MFPHRPVLACALIASLWGPAAQVSPAVAQGETTTSAPQLVLDLQGFSGLVTSLSFSARGDLLAAAGGKVVRIWNIESGQLIATLRGETRRTPFGNCYAVAFSPDGRELLVGIDDYSEAGSIRVYQTSDLGEIAQLVAGHRAPVKRLAFTRDGRYMASAGENGKIIVWNWPARRAVGAVEPRDPNQPLYHVFSIPSADPLLLVNEAAGPSVISLETARRLSPGDPIPESLRSWLTTNSKVRFPHGAAPASLSLQLDQGGWLAAGLGKEGGADHYWAASFLADAIEPRATYRNHRYVITATALSADGTLAASADVLGEVHVWDTLSGASRHVFRSLGRPVYRAALDAAGKRLALGSEPHAAADWARNRFADLQWTFDLATRAVRPGAAGDYPQEVSGLGEKALDVAYANDLFFLTYSSRGVEQQRYQVRAGAAPMCFSLIRSPRLGIDPAVLLGDDSGGLLCYNPLDNEQRREFIGHDTFVTSLSESAGGRLLATSSTDRTVRLWSLENYQPTGDVDFRYLSDTVIEVRKNTSAAAAGIQVGDRFLSMDGHDLTELARMQLEGAYHYLPGQRVQAGMERGGREYQTELVLKAGADLVEPLLNFLIVDDRQWIIWTPQGYYDASPGADRLIGWHVNQGPRAAARFYRADQFKTMYRPDIIDRAIETGNLDEAIRQANAAIAPPAAAPPPAIDLRKPDVLTEMAPPKVRILAPVDGLAVHSSQLAVLAEVESQNNLPITDVSVLVNGRPALARGIVRDRSSAELRTTFSQQVALSPGANQVSVIAANSVSKSAPVTVNVICQAAPPELVLPNCYLLAIGISQYQKQNLNLKYADLDARAFAAAWQNQQGVVYRTVEAKVITNEEATVRSILDAMDWLVKSVTQRDIAVMFISAHGLRDVRQNYYLASAEIDPGSLRSTGVRFSEITEMLRDLPCKVLLFADTCHSGGITGAKAAGWDDPLHDLVSEEYGAVVFSSSLPREVSLENPAWGHGAFTKALLDAFASPDSDNDGDGFLSLTELEDQVYRRVKELTEGAQHPVVERPPTIRNFNFYYVGRT